ncbi:MAG TPA: hypothetical protein VH020_13115 [Stellaceae bacterium]|nr:hypothetical protein [Stellaceae bacterium]
MRSLKPLAFALAFMPLSVLLVAWVVAGCAVFGLSFVGFLVVVFGRPGARVRLGV